MPKAIVASSSRKYVRVLNNDNQLLPGVLVSKDLSTVVGDQVVYELQTEKEEVLVSEILERKNLLVRSAYNKTKELASNVDLLVVVCAPKPLFNKIFIDRVLTTASAQNIKVVLLVNKSDLDLTETQSEIEIYKRIGIEILYSSSKKDQGLKEIENKLTDPAIKIACFLGLSGVGKSSIINKLCPEQELRIDEVSVKSGQGKQTTTVAHAYKYKNLLLVDLPGIQNFGVMHLTLENIKRGFNEIFTSAQACKYSNCSHKEEPECNVKNDILSGNISSSRYESYLELVNEHEQAGGRFRQSPKK